MDDDFREKLLNLYRNFDKVYGVFTNNCGRKFVILYKSPNVRKTLSYPKALVEVQQNRFLLDNETVDHIDRNYENNSLENLQILDRKIHAELDAKRVSKEEFKCVWCGELFERDVNTQHHNSLKKKAGPFCGKSCAGKYGRHVQITGQTFDIAKTFPKEERNYYKLIK